MYPTRIRRFISSDRFAVPVTVNSSEESKHLSRNPCATSNHSEHRPSSFRSQALIPSWNMRITSIICGGTPKRASTCQISVRLKESYAFCSLVKHRNSGTLAFASSSPSLRSVNIISVVERCGRNPHCSSDSSLFASQEVLSLIEIVLRRTLSTCAASKLPRTF